MPTFEQPVEIIFQAKNAEEAMNKLKVPLLCLAMQLGASIVPMGPAVERYGYGNKGN